MSNTPVFESDVILDAGNTLVRVGVTAKDGVSSVHIRAFTPASKGTAIINGIRSALIGEMRATVSKDGVKGIILQALDRAVAEEVMKGIRFCNKEVR